MSDLDIEKSVVKKNIIDVATKLGLTSDDLILYGKDKAKIIVDNDLKKGKLILVTAINPTPYGEGKTTVSIGLNDGLNLLNKKRMNTIFILFYFKTLTSYLWYGSPLHLQRSTFYFNCSKALYFLSSFISSFSISLSKYLLGII